MYILTAQLVPISGNTNSQLDKRPKSLRSYNTVSHTKHKGQ